MDIVEFITLFDQFVDNVGKIKMSDIDFVVGELVGVMLAHPEHCETLHAALQDEIEYYSQFESESEAEIIENLKRCAAQLNFNLIPTDNQTNRKE